MSKGGSEAALESIDDIDGEIRGHEWDLFKYLDGFGIKKFVILPFFPHFRRSTKQINVNNGSVQKRCNRCNISFEQ